MDRMERLREKARNLTDKPGVYLMKDASGEIIYVGKAKVLKNRVSSYFRNNASHDEKVRKMVSHVEEFDFIVTASEFEALVLECSLIKQYTPKYNILLKDDKGYHYIKVSDDLFPRITAEKQKVGSGVFLGPYTSSFAVRQAVDEANKAFMLPTCTRKFTGRAKTRPCLNYYIKQCSGACTGKISLDDYNDLIRQAMDYIKGGSAQSVETLTRQMQEAADRLDFEKAMELRNRIKAIQKVSESQKIILDEHKNLDVIAMVQNGLVVCFVILKFREGRLVDKVDFTIKEVYDPIEVRSDFIARYYSTSQDIPKVVEVDIQELDANLLSDYLTKLAGHKVNLFAPQRGEGKRLIEMASSNAAEQLSYKVKRTGREVAALDELTKLLGLPKTPEYIEAYDISNLGDSGIVGGMVAFENGAPKKSAYKKFSIKSTESRDDYASMREMLSRRLARYEEEKEQGEGFGRLPDLILLDGGKGHVAAVGEVIDRFDLNIPYFGMVKDDRHRTRAIAKQGGEISISSFKSAFALVTRIQDEVHRYTISYQRKVRKKTMFELELTKIKGIGEKKALALFRHFKTKSAFRQADVEEIARVGKITEEKAQEIQRFMNNIQ